MLYMPSTRVLKALSFRQPWANAILSYGKDIENRSWATAVRGTIAIHASQARDTKTVDEYFTLMRERSLTRGSILSRSDIDDLPRGVIVGLVDVVDCVTSSQSPWFEGPFGFVLAHPQRLTPIPCRGALQFFDLPGEVALEISRQIESRSTSSSE
jgi:hypothetical protein